MYMEVHFLPCLRFIFGCLLVSASSICKGLRRFSLFRKQGKRIRQIVSIAQNHEAGAAFEPQSGEILLVQPLILRETALKCLMRLP